MRGKTRLVRGARLLAGVIAAASANLQASVPRSVSVDLYLAEPSLVLGTGGAVVDRVLIANIASHGPRNLIDFVEILGEESDAAGVQRELLERALSAFLPRPAENSNGVNDRAIVVLNPAYGLLKRV